MSRYFPNIVYRYRTEIEKNDIDSSVIGNMLMNVYCQKLEAVGYPAIKTALSVLTKYRRVTDGRTVLLQ